MGYTIRAMSKERILALKEIFLRIVRKFIQIDALARDYGSGDILFPAEIHLLDLIGRNPGITVTGLARRQRVTKGAVSQVVKKLGNKGLVRKCRALDSEKSILLILTERGTLAFVGHGRFHAKHDQQMLEALLGMPEERIVAVERFMQLLEETSDAYLKDPQ